MDLAVPIPIMPEVMPPRPPAAFTIKTSDAWSLKQVGVEGHAGSYASARRKAWAIGQDDRYRVDVYDASGEVVGWVEKGRWIDRASRVRQ